MNFVQPALLQKLDEKYLSDNWNYDFQCRSGPGSTYRYEQQLILTKNVKLRRVLLTNADKDPCKSQKKNRKLNLNKYYLRKSSENISLMTDYVSNIFINVP
jgi:hypothetical protein